MRSGGLVLASIILIGVGMSGCVASSGHTSAATLALDGDCRDGGDIDVDGVRWFLDHGSDVPEGWRNVAEVEGTIDTNNGVFVAEDGTRLKVRNDFRKLGCSLWQ